MPGRGSDAEVIALAIKSALEIGITDLQVSIGQTEFSTVSRDSLISVTKIRKISRKLSAARIP